MNTHAPLHRPPHARLDHDAIHRATLTTRRPIRRHRQLFRRGPATDAEGRP